MCIMLVNYRLLFKSFWMFFLDFFSEILFFIDSIMMFSKKNHMRRPINQVLTCLGEN